MKVPDWSGSSGDIWARRWRDTDRALAEVGAALDAAILREAPAGAFRTLDVGCGPGTTALALAASRADAEILGCDVSRSLIAIAEERAKDERRLRFVTEDAESAAPAHGPFDLLFSRHGVMFFADPVRAFASLRGGTRAGARLVFSCFRAWQENPWASEVASAAAGKALPAPGRESGPFAFADEDYVREILTASGWSEARPEAVDFTYRAGDAVAALDFFAEVGPAARVLGDLEGKEREAAIEGMRAVIDRERQGPEVTFPGAAWIWTAKTA